MMRGCGYGVHNKAQWETIVGDRGSIDYIVV